MEQILLIAIIALLSIAIFLIFSLTKYSSAKDNGNFNESFIKFQTSLDKIEKNMHDQFSMNRVEINNIAKDNREELSKNLTGLEEKLSKNFKDVKNTIEAQLTDIRNDNTKQLEKMRNTVDEKLQDTLEKRIGKSFKLVSDRLEEVHKGLGQMQTIASGVGDLKSVLKNVKTRGVLGEFQLANILEQILNPDQYSANVATKPGSQANVEFAVKLPGKTGKENEEVWIPIDSKFPYEAYETLNNLYESNSVDEIKDARNKLLRSIETFAKDISEKYISPPNTVDFAIMFLPFEGCYAEILRQPAFIHKIRQKYQITITGPTTLAAFLNSLSMGFRPLAVQKRSSEVWKILSAVKSEFEKFGEQLEKVDKQLNTASKTIGVLRNTRSNAIVRKMRDIETIDTVESDEILEIASGEEDGSE